jgi:hypothetical protein
LGHYQLLDLESKKKYFDDKEVFEIHQFVDNAKDSLEFVIVNPILSTFSLASCSLEHDDDSTSITKATAMKLFNIQENGPYIVTIKNLLRFWLAKLIDHTFASLLFYQTAATIT